ncbi:MAG: hypothetical protein IJ890_03480 [Clostridia bacterium]|nr:hypothetical protein [Clostridia bacterium]
MKEKLFIIAIAIGFSVGEYCSYADISKSTFEQVLLGTIAFCVVIFIYAIIDEIISMTKDNSNSKKERSKIVFQDCEKERAVKEHRNELFDSYAKRSAITMKTMK